LHKPNQNKMLQLGLLASPQSTCKIIWSKHFHTNKHLAKINKGHENIPQHLFWSLGLLFLLHAPQWVVQYPDIINHKRCKFVINCCSP
jgi:hypothetical protein